MSNAFYGSPQQQASSSPSLASESSEYHRRPANVSVLDTAMESFTDYARQHPETVALWCFGIGFILGWKLKPW